MTLTRRASQGTEDLLARLRVGLMWFRGSIVEVHAMTEFAHPEVLVSCDWVEEHRSRTDSIRIVESDEAHA